MEVRRLGSLEVSVVGIGGANFGNTIDEAGTRHIVDAAVDAGITFFDTADRYGEPVTAGEDLIGRALKRHGDKVVVATKFGRRLDDSRFGAKPAYVRAATEASLRRLQTDHIDLMQVHIPDPETPIEDTLGALRDLIDEGKIREVGGSNFSGGQLEEQQRAATSLGMRGFVSTQLPYSLLDRGAESDEIPVCRALGIQVLPYWPLFNGLLSGKYRAGQPAPASSRIGGKDAHRQSQILSERNLAIVGELDRFAAERGHTILELAFGWLLSHEDVPSVIAGVSSPTQVVSNVAAAGWLLSPDEIDGVEAIVGGPHPARAAS